MIEAFIARASTANASSGRGGNSISQLASDCDVPWASRTAPKTNDAVVSPNNPASTPAANAPIARAMAKGSQQLGATTAVRAMVRLTLPRRRWTDVFMLP